jgi:hypothetical protein
MNSREPFSGIGGVLIFPMRAFVWSLQMIAQMMQSIQVSLGEGVSMRDGGINQAGRPDESQFTQSVFMEDKVMTDQDLGGDDLKYVTYAILFTKRDFEATLEKKQEDLVNYPTNPASFGGLKIAEFMGKVARGQISRKAIWGDKEYRPKGAASDTSWEFDDDDKRYIVFDFEVVRRIPREEAEYDRDQVKVLREIRQSIDGLSNKIK